MVSGGIAAVYERNQEMAAVGYTSLCVFVRSSMAEALVIHAFGMPFTKQSSVHCEEELLQRHVQCGKHTEYYFFFGEHYMFRGL